MDNLDFLDGQTPEPAATPEPQVAEQAPEPQAEAPQGPARGPDGKFVAKSEGEPTPQPEAEQPAAQPPAPAQPQPQAAPEGYVPLSAFMQLRDEIKELKRQPQAPAQPPPPAPDPYEDPEGYDAYQQQRIESAMYAQTLQWSRRFAESQHGPEAVNAAFEWGAQRCDNDPFFNQKVRSSSDPIGYVVGEWKREQLLSKLTDPADIDAFLQWRAGQAPVAPQAAAPAAPSQPTPTRSLAAEPAAGSAKPGAIPVHDGAAFMDVFRN